MLDRSNYSSAIRSNSQPRCFTALNNVKRTDIMDIDGFHLLVCIVSSFVHCLEVNVSVGYINIILALSHAAMHKSCKKTNESGWLIRRASCNCIKILSLSLQWSG